MSGGQFLKEVAARSLPAPIGGLQSKRKLWSLKALEQALDGAQEFAPAIDDPLMQEIRRRGSVA
jgi:hypothetical protein